MPQSLNNISSLIDFRPQAVESWVRHLPRGSVGKTSELIYKALHQISEQQMRPADRFRVLESLRNSVEYSTANMLKHIEGARNPLPDKAILISNALHAIYNYMTQGYRTVFVEMKKQNFLFIDKNILATSLHRAIRYLQQSLFLIYQTYSAFHRDYWAQLHELYTLAEQSKLTDTTIGDETLQTKRKSTIENEYIHALLLHMAEPYHLRHGEITEVNRHLERWNHLPVLSTIDDVSELTKSEVLFIIELDQDQPPLVANKEMVTSDITECRILDNSRLLRTVKDELLRLTEQKKSKKGRANEDSISITLLRRLIESWGQTQKRLYPRSSTIEKVNITVGLHNTHMQLQYEQQIKNVKTVNNFSGTYTKPEFETIEVKDVNAQHSDIWSAIYAWTNIDTSSTKRPAPGPQQADPTDVTQENWTLLNESAHGFCIMSVEKQETKIQVGEVIGLKRAGADNRSVGIVRWIKAYGNKGIQIGGMLLSPLAISVGISRANADPDNKVIDRCLLLPSMKSLHRPDSILTFSRQYHDGDILILTQNNEEPVYICLDKTTADNGMISQYTFKEHDVLRDEFNEDTQTDLSNESQDSLHNFKDIWRSL